MAGAFESSFPHLGGKSAVALFAAVLVAFVVETQLTQYLQTTLEYKQSYFIFYIVHSCFSFCFPIHLIYLLSTTGYGLQPLLSGLRLAVARQLSPVSECHSDIQHRNIPTIRTASLIFGLSVFYSLPGLLWFAAVPLASVTDVTAIWNASAFFTYVFSVSLLGLKWDVLRLLAVCLATLGVVTVVYGGTTASTSGQGLAQTTTVVHKPAPFIGDLLTLVASLLYALYQVLYKKYIALPTDPELLSHPAQYHPVSSAENVIDGEVPLPVLKDELVYPPPFGLHPNLITASIGLCTFSILWIPIPLLHYLRLEEFQLPTKVDTIMAIAGIAASGVIFNAGYMVLLGVWGPIVTSVGSLLTIVLTLFSDLIFGTVALTLWGLLGTGMIVGAFAVLVYDML